MNFLTIALAFIAVGLSFYSYLQYKSSKLISQTLKTLEEDKKDLKEEVSQTRAQRKIIEEQLSKDLESQYNLKIKQIETANTKQVQNLEKQIERQETKFEKKSEKMEEEREHIHELKEELRSIKKDLLSKRDTYVTKEETLQETYESKLEKLSKTSKDDLRKLLQEEVEKETGEDIIKWQNKYLERARDDASEKAREIVALAVQRCSSEVANEFTLTTIKLESEDQKGKIIGKGGRNIQWLEKTLGVEIIVDESPELVTISGFSSVRRHIARRTLELLLEDGRIHPSSIETMYKKAQNEIAKEIAEAGQWAVNELGIYDFPAKLIRLIGRLKFRTSYGQNMIKHSVEMAKLAGLLAGQMNAEFPHSQKPVDVDICVKGALLHDIGKAIDEETTPKGNHISLGEKVCDQFGLDWRIRKCVSSHHDESYYDEEKGFCIEAALVDACDNISGGRLGARKETMEAYTERMEALEKVANSIPGVTKSWIMRGSRELWVFFDTETITPSRMTRLTRKIAKRIESTVKYPGEIKVVGLWEGKAVVYAT